MPIVEVQDELKIADVKPQEPKVLVKYDLGCGKHCREGFEGVDKFQVEGVKHVVDLEQFPWPWADSSVDEFHASHYVEHVANMDTFMDEVWRCLVPGGKFTMIVPYLKSDRAFQDPTHKQFISENRLFYYNKGWRDANGLQHYLAKCDFDFTYGWSFYPLWQNKNDEARQFAIAHYWNVVMDMQANFVAKK